MSDTLKIREYRNKIGEATLPEIELTHSPGPLAYIKKKMYHTDKIKDIHRKLLKKVSEEGRIEIKIQVNSEEERMKIHPNHHITRNALIHRIRELRKRRHHENIAKKINKIEVVHNVPGKIKEIIEENKKFTSSIINRTKAVIYKNDVVNFHYIAEDFNKQVGGNSTEQRSDYTNSTSALSSKVEMKRVLRNHGDPDYVSFGLRGLNKSKRSNLYSDENEKVKAIPYSEFIEKVDFDPDRDITDFFKDTGREVKVYRGSADNASMYRSGYSVLEGEVKEVKSEVIEDREDMSQVAIKLVPVSDYAIVKSSQSGIMYGDTISYVVLQN